jgi:hypothetical protein
VDSALAWLEAQLAKATLTETQVNRGGVLDQLLDEVACALHDDSIMHRQAGCGCIPSAGSLPVFEEKDIRSKHCTTLLVGFPLWRILQLSMATDADGSCMENMNNMVQGPLYSTKGVPAAHMRTLRWHCT